MPSSCPDESPSRRAFFKTVIAASLNAALPAPPRGEGDAQNGCKPSHEFLRALGILEQGMPRGEGGCLSAYRVNVSADACYGCGVCAKLCPSGALTWVEDLSNSSAEQIAAPNVMIKASGRSFIFFSSLNQHDRDSEPIMLLSSQLLGGRWQ